MDTHPFSQRLCAGVLSRCEYVAFLVQTYHYVVHTRPLLRHSGERLMRMGKPGPAQLFLQKAHEENGHEKWILHDLHALGEKRHIVHRIKPVPAVRAYVAWNSYTVADDSPVAFLGAAYVLEALSAARAGAVAKNLVGNTRISNIANAVMFLSGHANADLEHIVVLGRAIEMFADSERDRAQILLTAEMTRASYMGLYAGIATISSNDTTSSAVIPGP